MDNTVCYYCNKKSNLIGCCNKKIYACACGSIHKRCLRTKRLESNNSSYKCQSCGDKYVLLKIQRIKYFRLIKLSSILLLELCFKLSIIYAIIALSSFISWHLEFYKVLNLSDSLDPMVKYYLSGLILLFALIGIAILVIGVILAASDSSKNNSSGTNIVIFGDGTSYFIYLSVIITFVGFVAFVLFSAETIYRSFKKKYDKIRYTIIIDDYEVIDNDFADIENIQYAELVDELDLVEF